MSAGKLSDKIDVHRLEKRLNDVLGIVWLALMVVKIE
jgi:hypothetical protein